MWRDRGVGASFRGCLEAVVKQPLSSGQGRPSKIDRYKWLIFLPNEHMDVRGGAKRRREMREKVLKRVLLIRVRVALAAIHKPELAESFCFCRG
jgi:hypothetical protein